MASLGVQSDTLAGMLRGHGEDDPAELDHVIVLGGSDRLRAKPGVT